MHPTFDDPVILEQVLQATGISNENIENNKPEMGFETKIGKDLSNQVNKTFQ